MAKPKTVFSIANEICMKRSLFKGTFLLVEGYTDARCFKKFIDQSKCRVKGILNKDWVLEVVEILRERNVKGILAIVDADFDVLEHNLSKLENLLYTDYHDMETMILASPALDNYLLEYGDENSLNNFLKKRSMTIREILIDTSAPIGYLRWFSLRNSLSIKFRDLNFNLFVEFKTLELDYDKLIDQIMKNTLNGNFNPDKANKEIKKLHSLDLDPFLITSGHDMIKILLIGLKRVFGHNIARLKKTKLEADLRLAYEFRFFQKTNLYKSMRQWEEFNFPFRIFNMVE